MPRGYEMLRAATMLHAGIAAIAGLSMLLGVPVMLWLVLHWSWFAWPVLLAAHPNRSLSGVLVPSGAGLLLLAPNLFWFWLLWFVKGPLEHRFEGSI